MKKLSRKTVVLTTIAAGILASSLAAAAVSNVANTKHNFSNGGNSNNYHNPSTNPSDSQVCVYCHTPHNAGQTRLLWNKAGGAAINFKLYTSSATITSVTKTQSALTANSPSLLCLGCHDGKTAMNVLHAGGKGVSAASAGLVGYPANSKLAFGSTPIYMEGPLTDMFGNSLPSMNLGRASDGSNDMQGDNLSDDHPIGFSYSDAYTEQLAKNGLFDVTTVGTKSSNAIRFFGTNNKVECSTCHDPHVDYSASGNPALKPFLVMSNSASALCLSCHNK